MQDRWPKEFEWNDLAIQLLSKDQLMDQDNVISWGAFHASNHIHVVNYNCLSSLLPLFPEKAASLSMVRHGMGVIKSVTDYLDTQQVGNYRLLLLISHCLFSKVHSVAMATNLVRINL